MTDDMPGGAGGRERRPADPAPGPAGPRPGPAGTPTGSAAPPAGGRRLLTRARQPKVLGGVCGGLGRFFGIDPVIPRVVLAVLALTGGIGLIAYGIGWLLIPMDGEPETEVRRLLSGRIEGTSMTAVLCALVGSGLFLSTMDNGKNQAFSLSLIVAVVAAVYWSQRRRLAPAEAQAAAAAPVTPAPPAAQPPPAGSPSWWRATAAPLSFEKAAAPGDPRYPRYVWGPDDRKPEPGARTPRRPPESDRPRERVLFGFVTFLLALAATAGTAAVGWRERPVGTTAERGLAAGIAVLGLGLVVGALRGRRGRGLAGWAVVASVLLAGAAVLPKTVGTDWQRRTWRPVAAAGVAPAYSLGAGEGVLDLRGLALGGTTTATTVRMGAGRLVLRVPEDATVQVKAHVGLGDVRFPGTGHHDVDVTPGNDRSTTFLPPVGTASAGTITVTLRLGVGQVEVVRGPLP